MQKNTIAVIALVLVIIAGIIFYAGTKPLPTKAPTTNGTATSLPDGSYSEHKQYYDIVAYYATSTPLGLGQDAAVSLMKNFVSDTIAQFKTDENFSNLTSEDIQTMGLDQGRKEKLEILYLMASAPHTTSYIFTIYEDTLGAHGNSFFHTFNFNTQTGASLSLSDIFLSNSHYLDRLSTLSRKELPAVIGSSADAAYIQSGTTPEEKSFQSFFFDNRYFTILFPAYKVGPYAAGPQTLRIPISELADILKPEYR